MTGGSRPGVSLAPDPRKAYDAGLAALDRGGDSGALARVDAALLHHAGHAGLWQVKALLHRALDDMAAAGEAFTRAAYLAPSDARVALGRAHTAFDAGLSAMGLFEQAAALATDRRTVVPGLIAATLAERGCVAATALADALVAANPAWLDGHWLLARLCWMAGDRAGSTASIERAVALAPRDLDRWRLLIFILMHSGREEEALGVIARARAAAGANAAFDVAEAACLTETWQLAAADDAFTRLGASDDPAIAIPAIRHALRAGRPEQVARRATLLDRPDGRLFAPYLSIAWRMVHDPRGAALDDPDFIRTFDIADALPSLSRLAAKVRVLHEGGGQPLEQSVRNGSQTDAPLLSNVDPDIRALRRALMAAIEDHVARLPPRRPGHPLLGPLRDGSIRFAGSWSVRLTNSGYHTNHVHPSGWISSAFYLAVPGLGADEPEHSGWLALGQPPGELGIELEPIHLVEPRAGRLVLFPSTMWHGTRPFAAGERLSVAFDVARPGG